MISRRDFLKQATFLAGGTGLWSGLPTSIRRALEINPVAGSTFEDAEHIVLLMQENRSFDHCFGTLQGVRGFNDPRAISIPGGLPVWIQSNKEGKHYAPFRLNMKDTRATWMGDLPHSWPNQVDARNNGKYNGWLEAKRPRKEFYNMPLTMGYYNREDIPFYYAMADAFTVCDQNFCSALTGTTANRSYFWTGTIRERPGEQANVLNSDTYYNREASWKTFPERLEEQGVSWKVYQNEISLQTGLSGDDVSWLANFTNNNLEWFSNYHVRFHRAHYDFLMRRISELPEEIAQLNTQIRSAKQNEAVPLNKQLAQKNQQLLKYKQEAHRWSPDSFKKLTPFQRSIHRRAFTTNIGEPDYHETEPFVYQDNGDLREMRLPKGDILHQFRKDVDEGVLPTVSWLVAPKYFSDHPSAPWFGAWYVSQVLDILTKNPEIWKKTIFILNYDENDGYFDHIPPFTPPKPGDAGSGRISGNIDVSADYVLMEEEKRRTNINPEDARESPIGLGYRVPLIIASPWSRGGWVNSQVFDITSTLQFLEKFLSKKTGREIKETNISEWRRVVTGDLTSVFRPYDGEKIELPRPVDKEPFVKLIYNAKYKESPSGYRELLPEQVADIRADMGSSLLPGQEPGVRSSCALPYELYSDGLLSADAKLVEVTLRAGNRVFGTSAVGSPFTIYAPGEYLTRGEFEEARSWSFAVSAGDEINYQWPLRHFKDERYHLRLYGPNGFFREFVGNKNDPKLSVNLEYEKHGHNQLTGNVLLRFDNPADREIAVRIIDNAYDQLPVFARIAGNTIGKTIPINLSLSSGWYDISVQAEEMPDFFKRYAGRVETGRHSITDPFMGTIDTMG